MFSVIDTTSSGRYVGWKDASPGPRGITKTSAQVLAADTMTSPVLYKKKNKAKAKKYNNNGA